MRRLNNDSEKKMFGIIILKTIIKGSKPFVSKTNAADGAFELERIVKMKGGLNNETG